MEFGELVINRCMGDIDLIKSLVFPELFSISQFNIGKAVLEVVIEGAFVQ